MSDLSTEPIDLSSGQIIDPLSPEVHRAVLDAVVRAAATGVPYAERSGDLVLRRAVAEHYARRTGRAVAADRITVVPGARQGLFAAMTAVARGAQVLVPSPHWSHYPGLIRLAGAEPVLVPGNKDDSWRLHLAELDARRTPRTAAVLLNSPVNPTGAVQDRHRVHELAEWTAAHGLRLIVDDVYWAFSHADEVVAAAGEEALVVGGASKVHGLAGLRVGWVWTPAPLTDRVIHVVDHVTGPTSLLSQAAAAAALACPSSAEQVADRARRIRRDLAAASSAFSRVRAVDVVPASDGMYLCLSVERLLARRPWGAEDDRAVCAAVEARTGVRLRAGSTFGLPGHVRLCVAAPEPVLEEAAHRLDQLFRSPTNVSRSPGEDAQEVPDDPVTDTTRDRRPRGLAPPAVR